MAVAATARPAAGPGRGARRAAALALALGLGVASGAPAFHERGVANCDGCHVMHDSGGGLALAPQPGGDAALLAETPSDVCLSCHARSLGAVLGLNPLAPPPEKGSGNFVFLLEDNLNDGPDGRLDPIPGAAAGHNLVAPGHGLTADFRYTSSPGGAFPASRLGCTSCHDPHGTATFRMLHGAGPVQGGIAFFTAEAPQAEGIDLAAGTERRDEHTAYRAGMTLWCGNCHGRYHDQGDSGFEHPVDETLGPEERRQYERYDGAGNPTGGSAALSYLPETPFEDAGATTSSRAGPTISSRVACVSCHRAHASSGPAAGRWDFNVDVLQDDGVESGSWPLPNPYGEPDQAPLCIKCHESIPD